MNDYKRLRGLWRILWRGRPAQPFKVGDVVIYRNTEQYRVQAIYFGEFDDQYAWLVDILHIGRADGDELKAVQASMLLKAEESDIDITPLAGLRKAMYRLKNPREKGIRRSVSTAAAAGARRVREKTRRIRVRRKTDTESTPEEG